MIYLFILFAAMAVLAVLWAGVMALGMLRQFRRPSARARRDAPTPLNALLTPSLLTERGQQLRRRYFAGLAGCALSASAAGIVTLWL
jgi:hypothetical protein